MAYVLKISGKYLSLRVGHRLPTDEDRTIASLVRKMSQATVFPDDDNDRWAAGRLGMEIIPVNVVTTTSTRVTRLPNERPRPVRRKLGGYRAQCGDIDERIELIIDGD